MSSPSMAELTPSVEVRPTLSAVVCAYTTERWDDVVASVASLHAQSEPCEQLILVIDHNPELASRARRTFEDVLVLDNAGARGLSGARNTGVEAATSDVVTFLDDDATAEPTWAERLRDAYADAQVIGVGGAVLPSWRAPRPSWFPEEFLWVVGCSYTGQPTSRSPVRNPIGANMSFRRDVLQKAGGFSAAVGRSGKDAAGCEETELAIRAKALYPDGVILLDPAAVCRHAVTPDRVTRRYFRRRCRAEGRSKATVSGLAGAGAALASERTYVREILPRAVVRGVREAAAGDRSGAARSWVVVEGLILTASSYLAARTAGVWAERRVIRAAR